SPSDVYSQPVASCVSCVCSCWPVTFLAKPRHALCAAVIVSRSPGRSVPALPLGAPLGSRESSVARSVFDCDECADRGVRPDLCGGGEWKLDAAEALWGAKGGAVEGVDRVAAVEVADVADAWVVVAGPVWVGAAHRADGDVLEDGEGAELGRGGGNTRI